MYKFLFNKVRKLIPRISETELIARRSGNTSLDRDILRGSVSLPKKVEYQNKFSDENVNILLKNFDGSRLYPNDNNNKWINYVAKQKYFSFIIDEEYGGNKLSVNELSNILTKI